MKTNLIYALRNITKNSINSLISVVGLAIAVACCLWIYFFVNQEKSYNNYIENADRIYRMNYTLKYVDNTFSEVRLEPEIADIFQKKVPQIEKSTEYRFAYTQMLKHNEEFFDTEMSYADREFFEIFNLEFLAGDKSQVFLGPNEIVITQKLADILLRKKNKDYSSLIGQSVEFPVNYDNRQFQITGIIKNLPRNTSFREFGGIIPGDNNGQNFGGCDNNLGYTSIFYLVKEGADSEQAEKNAIREIHQYYDSRVQRMKNENQLLNVSDAFVPFTLPVREVYSRDDVFSCYENTSSPRNANILISIGILILLIACCNYTLLSLGQAIKKMEEVGVRKAMGARRANVFSIFFYEGIILTGLAFLVGTILCFFFLQYINNIASIEIYTEIVSFPGIILFALFAFSIVVILISAIPMLVFSNFNPSQLVGKRITAGKKSILTQTFVSFQYSLSIILIIVTISFMRQSNYLKNKSLGVTTENIIDLSVERMENDQKILLRNLIEEHPGVLNLSLCARNFLNGSSDNYVDKGNGERIDVNRLKVDEKYISTIDLQLIHGKNFSFNNLQNGDRSMIVNSKFTKAFEIQDNPIGQVYRFGNVDFTIIGVVEDFFFSDLTNEINPVMLFTRANWGNGYYRLLIRFQPNQLVDVMDHIKKCYRKVAPGTNFDYTFWDEELGKRYAEEERWSKIVGIASVIAILISSLGLFGLTILLINQRIKEIGIRKVNGARSTDVLITINKTFVSWLLGSILVATPVGYYIVKIWLRNYPYNTGIGWWVFFLAGFIALGIALITVSWQSWRAATRNPVEALRYE